MEYYGSNKESQDILMKCLLCIPFAVLHSWDIIYYIFLKFPQLFPCWSVRELFIDHTLVTVAICCKLSIEVQLVLIFSFQL